METVQTYTENTNIYTEVESEISLRYLYESLCLIYLQQKDSEMKDLSIVIY